MKIELVLTPEEAAVLECMLADAAGARRVERLCSECDAAMDHSTGITVEAGRMTTHLDDLILRKVQDAITFPVER